MSSSRADKLIATTSVSIKACYACETRVTYSPSQHTTLKSACSEWSLLENRETHCRMKAINELIKSSLHVSLALGVAITQILAWLPRSKVGHRPLCHKRLTHVASSLESRRSNVCHPAYCYKAIDAVSCVERPTL